MKGYLYFLLFLFASNVFGQTSNNPDLVVVKKKWKVVYTINPVLSEDPMKINEAYRPSEVGAPGGTTTDATGKQVTLANTGINTSNINAAMRDSRAVYLYQIKLKNLGEKTIKSVSWEYVFYDPVTKNEVGRRRFISKLRISPNKTTELTETSPSPPTGSIDAKTAGKKQTNSFSEEVILQKIEYVDGTIWNNSLN